MKLPRVTCTALSLVPALLASVLFAIPSARATDANSCGYVQGPGGWYKSADRSGPYAIDGSCGATLLGSGGGGGGGSVTITGTLPAFAAPPTVNAGLNAGANIIGAVNPDITSTGATINSATPNAAVTINLENGKGTAAYAVSGLTASGATLAIEASDDGGTTWAAVNGVAPQTGALFSTLTTDQQFRVNVAGRTNVRVRVSVTGTGTITVSSNAGNAQGVTSLGSPLPSGSNAIGSVGLTGNSGTPSQTTISVLVTSTTVLAASGATSFLKLCVPQTAANGIWVNWAAVAAVAAPPSEYMSAGQCDIWTKATGYLPTGQINAIAAATTAVTLIHD